jgi:hypothetical protein
LIVIRSRSKQPLVFSFFIILFAAVFFSMGPEIVFGNHTFSSPVSLLYTLVPLVSSLRTVRRMMIIGYFAIALLGAFGLKQILGKLPKQTHTLICIILFLIITVEYFPPTFTPYHIKKQTISFYTWLNRQTDIETTLELPIGNDDTASVTGRPVNFDARYLLYALYHNKNIVNGYTSFNPPESEMLAKKLLFNFPTAEKIANLKTIGVDLIIVHEDEWNSPLDAPLLLEKLRLRNLKEAYSQDGIFAFRI